MDGPFWIISFWRVMVLDENIFFFVEYVTLKKVFIKYTEICVTVNRGDIYKNIDL